MYKRVTKNFDRENFILDFLDIDWAEWLETGKEDINHSSSRFILKMNDLLDKYAPLKKLPKRIQTTF